MKRITFVVGAVILVVAAILAACQSAQPVQVPQPVHVVVDNANEFTGIGVAEGGGEQGLIGAPTNIRSLIAGEALVKGNFEVDGTATLDTMIVTMTETERLQIVAPTAQPTATPGLRINVLGVNEPLTIEKASTPVARISGAGGATFETLLVNTTSTLTGAVNAATALLTGRQVVTLPTAQATATPGVFVNSAGAVSALQVWALNATPVVSFDRTGNGTFSGVLTAAGPSVLTAPTSIPTAQPAFAINSTGVSRAFEVQKAATPVAAIDKDGNLTASGTGTFTGAIYGPVPVLAKTTNYNVTAADSGAIIKASGNITLTLPGAAVGLNYCVYNYDGGDLKIEFTDATDVAINEVNSPGDSITNTTALDNICLAALDVTNWATIGTSIGTWADGN